MWTMFALFLCVCVCVCVCAILFPPIDFWGNCIVGVKGQGAHIYVYVGPIAQSEDSK